MKYLIIILIIFSSCERNNLHMNKYTLIPIQEDSCIFVEDMNHIVIDGFDYTSQSRKRVHCVNVFNCSDVQISNLSVGSGGITISNNKPQKNFNIFFVLVKNAYNGILIYPEDSLENVTIEASSVDSSRNNGIMVFSAAWPKKDIYNVTIKSTSVLNTRGDKDVRPHTGSGMYISCTVKGLIDNCVAMNNGWEYGHGNIGIWTFDSEYVTIKNSLSASNRSITGVDGGGFDIDGGSYFCKIDSCSSFDNDGAGYLLYEYGSPNKCSNNSFENNTSLKDGRKNKNYSAFSLGGVKDVYDTYIIGNKATLIDDRPAVTYFNKSVLKGLTFKDNNF